MSQTKKVRWTKRSVSIKKYPGNYIYIEGRLKNQLYLHNFACDLLMLCKEDIPSTLPPAG